MNIRITSPKGAFDVTELVPSVKWSGDYQQAARSLEFSLVASTTDRDIPAVACPLGASVQFREGGKLLFDGFILARKKSTGASQITLSCYDRGFYLKQNKASYKFQDQPPEAIAARVAGDFGITAGELAATGVPVSRIFWGGSLYDILSTAYTLASRVTGEKYHIGFEGDKLCVRVRKPDTRTLVVQGGSNLIEAATTESVERMVNAVAIYDQTGNLVSRLEDAETIALYGQMQEVVKQTAKDDKAAAAQKLLDDGGARQQITLDCLGDVRNVTGGCVIVRESFTGLNGLFYIDSDIHEWKRGQYYNKLVLNFENIMNEKEAGSQPG